MTRAAQNTGEAQEPLAAFEVMAPSLWAFPIVFSSPHSGRHMPPDLLQLTHLSPDRLRRSEDAYVDELFMGCVDNGAPLLRALLSRAYLDLNREPYELDSRMFVGELPGFFNGATPRVMSGLGTVPRVVAEGEDIYRCKLLVSDALQRIEYVYFPFHRALAALLEQARTASGMAVLIDCHSMPATALSKDNKTASASVDIVLGDRFGTSAAPHLMNQLESCLLAAGLKVRRNRPYAGGFITETYGVPARNQHAIQIEINRSLYMNEATLEKGRNFHHLKQTLSTVIQQFMECLGENGLGEARQAAE